MKIIRTIGKYLALLFAVSAAACLLQYLAGLVPQQAVRAHLLESMPQLIGEGLAPGVLYDGHPRSKLDNLSENYILTYSYYMDTRTDAASVLSNPGRQIQDPYGELFLQTEELLARELPPDTAYVRYWLGFRMYVRPMLAIMNYMDARQCIMWGFFLLLIAAAVALYRQTGSAPVALAFGFSVSQLNPIVIASCFQYAACFYIAFAGMLLVPAVQKGRLTQPMLFFVLGLVTQIFDFYTAPLITFGFPVLSLLLLAETRALDGKARRRLLGITLLTWAVGYVGAWGMKMLLTTLFTPHNALYDGLSRLAFWMRPGEGAQERFLAFKAVYWCTINILDLVPLVLEGALVALYAITVIKKRPGKRVFAESLPFLAVALLPFIWFMLAAKPSYEQFYFQYRSLGMFLFGGLLFLLYTAGWARPHEERPPAM